MTSRLIDIKENDILARSPELLDTLLADRTMTERAGKQVNIFWGTDNYAERGAGYQYDDKITLEAITGDNGNVIVPRALKTREVQKKRTRSNAEIFTPSWICNIQCNLVDNSWFGREGVFNTEVDNPDGTHTWIVNEERIIFPKGKTWLDYVTENRMELTCGEAPYIVSRYDAVTGEFIPIKRRIGMLDRKLRIVNENTSTRQEWVEAAKSAFKSVYGYEWQGDNIVLARESLLFTFIEYFMARFNEEPTLNDLMYIAYIVSWNIWQMDGLKGVIPNTCKTIELEQQLTMFGDDDGKPRKSKTLACSGCRKKGNVFHHNGTYCRIMDWEIGKSIEFISLQSQYEKEHGKA